MGHLSSLRLNKAFTLVELLVVISIIGVLSSTIFASLNSSKSKARDAIRVANINQIKKALDLYYENKGYYPGDSQSTTIWYYAMAPLSGAPCGYVDGGPPPLGRWCRLETELASYIPKLPRDDIGGPVTDYRYHYKYNDQQKIFALSVILENSNNISQNDGGYFSNRYEVGDLPAFCLRNFTGSNADWTIWDYNKACTGS